MRLRALCLAVLAVVVGAGALGAGRARAATPATKLGLLATGGPQTVQPGSSISYTFTVVVNRANARGLILSDQLPANVTPVSVRTTDGSCTLGPIVRCSLGTVANHGTANIAIIGRANAAGAATNAGVLTAANQLAGQGHVRASATVTVAPASPPVAPTDAPTVSSGGLGQIDQHTAVVQAVLGFAPSLTTYEIQYGRTTRYGQTMPVRELQGDGGTMLELLRGLRQGVLYHFRAVARNSAGQSFGQDVSFRTLGRRRPALNATLAQRRNGSRRSAVMTATLQVPRGVTVPNACRGRLTFTLTAGRRVLARRRVSLNRACQARATVRLTRAWSGLRARAAFAGNGSVLARSVVVSAR